MFLRLDSSLKVQDQAYILDLAVFKNVVQSDFDPSQPTLPCGQYIEHSQLVSWSQTYYCCSKLLDFSPRAMYRISNIKLHFLFLKYLFPERKCVNVVESNRRFPSFASQQRLWHLPRTKTQSNHLRRKYLNLNDTSLRWYPSVKQFSSSCFLLYKRDCCLYRTTLIFTPFIV